MLFKESSEPERLRLRKTAICICTGCELQLVGRADKVISAARKWRWRCRSVFAVEREIKDTQ